jgi:predicted permease
VTAQRPSGLPAEIEVVLARVLEAAGLDALGDGQEVLRELRAHFEDGLAAGTPVATLLERFGDPAVAGRRIRKARRGGERSTVATWWSSPQEWWRLVRHATRRLARAPAFTAIVVGTLALGVGANTAIFTVIHAVLLEDLPYHEPDRLVRVYESDLENPDELQFLRAPIALEFRSWTDVFESFATLYTYRAEGADLTEGESPRRVTVMRVSAGYFETLGVPPALGRTFFEDESYGPGEAGETRDQIAAVAIVSHPLWTEQLGASAGAIGTTLRLDEAAFEVIGVMPAGFEDPFGSQADVWLPQDMRLGGSNDWGNSYLSAVARLRDGVSLEAARARTRARSEAFDQVEPESEGALAAVRSLELDVVGTTRRAMLWILGAAAGLVLLAACVNVANLLLSRGLEQDRRLALCAALGSGRARLGASIVVENGVLAALGGLAGLALAWACVGWIPRFAPSALPATSDLRLGMPVFAFAMGNTVAALLIFGFVPAVRLS